MKLLLFDIDGTLVRTAGAGKVSMERSFEQVFGIKNGFHDIQMMGRTDPSIVKEALSGHHLEWDDAKVDRFREMYFDLLENEIQYPRPGKRVCAGIPLLLEALHNKSEFILSLLTGNWQKSAFIKLGFFKIDHYFTMGAFADDSSDRNELVPIAIEKLEKEQKIRVDKRNIYVIGDTPLDIQCAKPHGVRTVAVATGFHSFQDLAVEKPDLLFHSFKDTEKALNAFSQSQHIPISI